MRIVVLERPAGRPRSKDGSVDKVGAVMLLIIGPDLLARGGPIERQKLPRASQLEPCVDGHQHAQYRKDLEFISILQHPELPESLQHT